MERPSGYIGNLTPEQNKVLNDFKSALSRRFSSPTYDEIPLTLWGVHIPRRTAKGELTGAQQALLLKFLRDSRWNPNDAAAKLAAALKWRVEYKIENLNREKFSEELSKMCYVYGVDRRGNPLIYANYAPMSKAGLLADVDKFVRWRVSILEKAMNATDFEKGGEKVTFIYDWSGCGLFLDGKLNESQKKLDAIIKTYYPECLESKVFINVPPLKEILNDIISFFHPGKSICVSPPKVRTKLLNAVSPDSIIPAYGGFDETPAGLTSVVNTIVIGAGKTFSADTPVAKGDTVLYSYVCREGDVTGSYGFKKEGKRFLDDKNQIAKKESGKGSYEVEKKGAFVLSFANEDPVGEKTVYFRTMVVSADDESRLESRLEKRKSKKTVKGKKDKGDETSSPTKAEPRIEISGADDE